MSLRSIVVLLVAFSYASAAGRKRDLFERLAVHHTAGGPPANALPTERYFTQTTAHFDDQDTRTFQQRYYVYADSYKPDGPVYLYIGGESQISPESFQGTIDGEPGDLARQHGGLLAAAEHRFYGKSVPVADLSTPNLALLSSEEALADLAAFREYLVHNYTKGSSSSRVISIGGSYPGALSAWFRVKYPHLVSGSLASSAPVLAKMDFYEYDQSVATAVGDACASAIRNATAEIEHLVDTNFTTTLTRFGCKSDSYKNTTAFLYMLADSVSFAVQYNTKFKPDSPLYRLRDRFCENITAAATPEDKVNEYAKFLQELNSATNQSCADWNMLGTSMTSTALNPASMQRQWYYQSCTQFGFFQTAPAKDSLRSSRIDVAWHLKACEQIFGKALQPRTAFTNTYYGGNQPVTTKTVFVNGGDDPWHVLSVTSPLACCSSVKTIVIPQASHCSDLYPPSPSDSPALVAARAGIDADVNAWAGESNVFPSPGGGGGGGGGDDSGTVPSWSLALIAIGAFAAGAAIYALAQHRKSMPLSKRYAACLLILSMCVAVCATRWQRA